MVTRAKNGIHKLKVFTAQVIFSEPSFTKEALNLYNKNFKPCRPMILRSWYCAKVIGNKWIFRVKLKIEAWKNIREGWW